MPRWWHFSWRIPGESASASELRAFLRTRLPAYMVPVDLPVPRNPAAYLEWKDRPAEAGIDGNSCHGTVSGTSRGPRNEAERRLLLIWKDVLKSTSDDITQDFFELGGHSLLAAKLLVRIEKEFQHVAIAGLHLPVADYCADGGRITRGSTDSARPRHRAHPAAKARCLPCSGSAAARASDCWRRSLD